MSTERWNGGGGDALASRPFLSLSFISIVHPSEKQIYSYIYVQREKEKKARWADLFWMFTLTQALHKLMACRTFNIQPLNRPPRSDSLPGLADGSSGSPKRITPTTSLTPSQSDAPSSSIALPPIGAPAASSPPAAAAPASSSEATEDSAFVAAEGADSAFVAAEGAVLETDASVPAEAEKSADTSAVASEDKVEETATVDANEAKADQPVAALQAAGEEDEKKNEAEESEAPPAEEQAGEKAPTPEIADRKDLGTPGSIDGSDSPAEDSTPAGVA